MQQFLVNMIPAHVRKRRRDHLLMSKEKVLRRLANEKTEHKDFIWYILKQRERHDLRQDEIIVNGALFIVAGSETTANALSGLIARLIWNPDKYAKLTKEIREAFTTEKEITNDNVAKLPYFNACIEEGLRIHPPVPVGLLRTVPEGGSYIDGNWVPAGVSDASYFIYMNANNSLQTSVAVNSWAASHNPANFRNPDSFIPERWIEDGYSTDIKKGMQPFSLGPRGCIGRQ